MIRLAVRTLREGDLGAADELRALAGWNQTRADWEWMLRWQPDGCLAAEIDGRLIATAVCLRYSKEQAWIAMMLVHPEVRRKGVGRVMMTHCLEYLRGAGVGCVQLDASPEGRELYLQLGFRDEWKLTRYIGGPFPTAPVGGVRETACGDLQRMIPMDAAASGIAGDLRAMLLSRLSDPPARAVMAIGGEGFGAIRPGAFADYLGPLVAKDAEIAAEIAAALTAGSAKVFWDIPEGSPVVNWAVKNGFVAQRGFTRMSFGQCAQRGAPETLFGIAGPEFG